MFWHEFVEEGNTEKKKKKSKSSLSKKINIHFWFNWDLNGGFQTYIQISLVTWKSENIYFFPIWFWYSVFRSRTKSVRSWRVIYDKYNQSIILNTGSDGLNLHKNIKHTYITPRVLSTQKREQARLCDDFVHKTFSEKKQRHFYVPYIEALSKALIVNKKFIEWIKVFIIITIHFKALQEYINRQHSKRFAWIQVNYSIERLRRIHLIAYTMNHQANICVHIHTHNQFSIY